MSALYTPVDDSVKIPSLPEEENGNLIKKEEEEITWLNKDVFKDEEKGDDDGDDNSDEESLEERHSWSKQREYVLSVMGYIVGVGNIFRFPYVCNKNGGGAFLLPFLLCLLLLGMPLFFLETAIGQFTSRSPFHVWSVCPLIKGVGIAMCILSAINFWYFNIIMAWTLYYLYSSFKSVLPWSRCDEWWNTERCQSHMNPKVTNVTEAAAANVSAILTISAGDNVTSGGTANYSTLLLTDIVNVTNNATETFQPVTSAEEFWVRNVLRQSDGLFEVGELVWPLVLCHLIVVIFIFLALIKGIKSAGKVVYVTAVAPYIILTVLVVRGVTLPGAKEGILYYLTPDFGRLLDAQVWVEAALQVFFSLGPGWGGIIAMASYSKFHNNCMRDAVVMSMLGELTSVFGGFAIFSVLGYLSSQSGVAIKDVVSSGPGMAFVVYPEAVSLMPLPQLWAVLFFLMLITLVVDSQLASAEAVLTTIFDQFPRLMQRRRIPIVGMMHVAIFLTSLIMITQAGVYVYQLVDWFCAIITLTTVTFLESIAIAWIYGADRFAEDIAMMIGRKPPVAFNFIWSSFQPFVLTVLLIFTFLKYEAPRVGDYEYDTLGNFIGWAVAFSSFIPIPVFVVWVLRQHKGTLMQRLKQSVKPSEEWGPADPTLRIQYQKMIQQRQPRRHWYEAITGRRGNV